MAQVEAGGWWDERKVEQGSGHRWVLGDFELVAFRAAGEWLLSTKPAAEDEVDCEQCHVTEVTDAPVDPATVVRFVSTGSQDRVKLLPRVADRSVVAKPRLPLHLLSGEKAKVYVSSPAWIEVWVGRPMHALFEVAVRRLSDTWFGPNTREGEVAYALKTHARVDLAELPRRCYRVITPISITNEDEVPLLLDRISLPVPRLSVYAASDGLLWSESVSLVRSGDKQLASLHVGSGPPREAKGARRLSQPRQTSEPNLLVRAFTNLFSLSQED